MTSPVLVAFRQLSINPHLYKVALGSHLKGSAISVIAFRMCYVRIRVVCINVARLPFRIHCKYYILNWIFNNKIDKRLKINFNSLKINELEIDKNTGNVVKLGNFEQKTK